MLDETTWMHQQGTAKPITCIRLPAQIIPECSDTFQDRQGTNHADALLGSVLQSFGIDLAPIRPSAFPQH